MPTLVERLPPDRNPVLVYLARLTSAHSRRSQGGAVAALARLMGAESAEEFPWWRLDYQHTAWLRARLAEQYKPATANRHLSALRGVLKESWRLELMTAEAFHRAADVANVKGSVLPAGRELTPGEVQALARACADDARPQGVRDGALLAVLHSGGLRRSEVVELNLSDYEPDTGQLRVRGKGRRERLVHLRNGAADAVEDWLHIRGPHEGPLFHPVRRNGAIQHRRMTPQSVLEICQRRAGDADVRPFSPHDLRRTLAGSMLENGVDLVAVQATLGHASPVTTARYARRGERAKQEAASKVHFPWPRRG